VLLGAYLVASWLRGRRQEATVGGYRRYMERLSALHVGSAPPPERSSDWREARILGLPPLGALASALALVALVVGVVGVALALQGGGHTGSKAPARTARPAASPAHHAGGTAPHSATTPTSPPLAPATSSASSVTYRFPGHSYSLVAKVTAADTWVEVVDGSGKVVIGSVVKAGSSVQANLAGTARITLGKPDVELSVNGIPLQPPSPNGMPSQVVIEAP
jgi:hypothetical protein